MNTVYKLFLLFSGHLLQNAMKLSPDLLKIYSGFEILRVEGWWKVYFFDLSESDLGS
jgi:hypothetical protein